MAKRKQQQDIETDDAPISLRRIEERIEMVPLTDEEKVERLDAAAGIESAISACERELSDLADQVKSLKSEIDVKIEEFRRSVREAHEGTKGASYDVIVERHPEHPAEMIVWRPADGTDPQAILDAPVPEGMTLEAHREAQGCTIVETRAMTPEELHAAEKEDWAHKHPELPFPEATASTETATGNVIKTFDGGKAEGESGAATDGDEQAQAAGGEQVTEAATEGGQAAEATTEGEQQPTIEELEKRVAEAESAEQDAYKAWQSARNAVSKGKKAERADRQAKADELEAAWRKASDALAEADDRLVEAKGDAKSAAEKKPDADLADFDADGPEAEA